MLFKPEVYIKALKEGEELEERTKRNPTFGRLSRKGGGGATSQIKGLLGKGE